MARPRSCVRLTEDMGPVSTRNERERKKGPAQNSGASWASQAEPGSASCFFEPPEGKLARIQRNKCPCLVLLTASALTRGKCTLAVIWICAVAVFEGFSVLIDLKVHDCALGAEVV